MNKNTVVGTVKEKANEVRGKVDNALGNTKDQAKALKGQAEGAIQKNIGKLQDI